ncbi:2'-5' RNA ligase family protein [Uliginosibacterium sp. H1]|uniref:2'-5' RNA ligase family protein n=1 Tax=Uliginosibacterium sp. H1 TaxID=3114757 RepID=UPI002E19EF45|nr:hypothetical protein [Uliginosibacterium sp. H1]
MSPVGGDLFGGDLFGDVPSQPLRLFYALWPTPEIARELNTVARGLQGRVMNEQGLHVTVGFAGAQLPERIPALCGLALRCPIPRVTLCVDHLQYWSQQFVVAVPRAVPPELREAVMRIHAEMRGLGMTVEPRSWSPHITLLRNAPQQVLPDIAPMAWDIDALHLAVSDGTGAYERRPEWTWPASR